MSKIDKDLQSLREDLKKHREILCQHDNTEAAGLAAAIDTFLLVTYDPVALLNLCNILTHFVNNQLGGEN